MLEVCLQGGASGRKAPGTFSSFPTEINIGAGHVCLNNCILMAWEASAASCDRS